MSVPPQVNSIYLEKLAQIVAGCDAGDPLSVGIVTNALYACGLVVEPGQKARALVGERAEAEDAATLPANVDGLRTLLSAHVRRGHFDESYLPRIIQSGLLEQLLRSLARASLPLPARTGDDGPPRGDLGSVMVDHIEDDHREVSFYAGEPADIIEQARGRILVIQAEPGRYAAGDSPMLQALADVGISVEELAQRPAMDFRPALPVWISTGASRIVVWEPAGEDGGGTGQKSRLIGTAFQALHEFVGTNAAEEAVIAVFPETLAPDRLQSMLRVAFYASTLLATRGRWIRQRLSVTPAHAVEGLKLFQVLGERYADPSIIPPPTDARGAGATTLAQAESLGITLVHSLAGLRDRGPRAVTGLTSRQQAAIFAYTQTLSGPLNSFLRYDDLDHPALVPYLAAMEALSAGLGKLRNDVSEDRYFRGVTRFSGIEEFYRDTYVTRELAFTSTSRSDVFPRIWTVRLGGKTGKAIAALSAYPTEDEVLFDHDLRYIVSDVRPDGDVKRVVTANETFPPTYTGQFWHM